MLQFQNSMTRKIEPFQSKTDRVARMFTCGPSIYRRPHVGNYRTFIWEDLLLRYLEYQGYDVLRVINFTDIEDKSIEEAQARGESVAELTGAVADRIMEEADHLRIKLPEQIPRSSTSVEQAAHLISKLIEKGYAYWHGGNVFFDPLKYKDFGKLFRLDMSRWPKERRRFKRDTYPGQRWNLGDFVLWHGCKEGDTVYWDTEIGRGRPAWNVQDPAMISQSLGYSLDIFCGGIDNMYRHHDYNIAVMESVSGEELARYWLHGQHVLVGGKKMSKSLNNIIYPEDLLVEGLSWEHIRYYLLTRHYRKRLHLSMEKYRKSGLKLNALRGMIGDITGKQAEESIPDKAVRTLADDLTSRFEAGLNNDLDSAAALEGVFDTVKSLHSYRQKGRIGHREAAHIESQLRRIDCVLQVLF
ncbi:MAG: class I tRNA ligase family protein [Syntrophobacteraceae bacterium]